MRASTSGGAGPNSRGDPGASYCSPKSHQMLTNCSPAERAPMGRPQHSPPTVLDLPRIRIHVSALRPEGRVPRDEAHAMSAAASKQCRGNLGISHPRWFGSHPIPSANTCFNCKFFLTFANVTVRHFRHSQIQPSDILDIRECFSRISRRGRRAGRNPVAKN